MATAWISWYPDPPWQVVDAAATIVGTVPTPRRSIGNGLFFGPGEDASKAAGVAGSAPVNPADAATGRYGYYSGHVETPGGEIEHMPRLTDVQDVLAWARNRADEIRIRPSWDYGQHYWGGASPSPRSDLPDLVIPRDAPGTSLVALSGDELERGIRHWVDGIQR